MFKTTIQRQARLSAQAYRQLSTCALRSLRSEAASRLSSPASVRPAVFRHLTARLYSAESAATSTDRHAPGSSTSSSGLVTQFADLDKLGVDPTLVRALTEKMGYDTMTEVQSLTINPALKGTDLVAQAKTGTGKTLAFLVPVFQRILAKYPELATPGHRNQATPRDIRAIIMSPTRELAEQIGVEARKLASHTGIVVQTAVGGTRKREALFNMRRQGCHILVATPGRLQDILSDPSSGVEAPGVQAVVLDEADRMLDVGFADDIRNILDLLPPIEQVDRQTLLYSATIPRDVVHLAKSMVKTDNFEFVQTIRADDAPTHEKVPQHVVAVNGYANWFPAVLEVADKAVQKNREDSSTPPFKAIVFFSNTATVQFANRVFRETSLGQRGSGVFIFEIHSKLTQEQRTRNAENFRRCKSGILISSDVTARGMDFPGVTHVIQVGLPPDRDQYIHRVGRTGRAGNTGEGWLIIAEDELAEARHRLPGLPIKPNHSLETAKYDAGSGDSESQAARYFKEIGGGYRRLPNHAFNDVYHALLGQRAGKGIYVEDFVRLLNDWAIRGIGMSETPSMNPVSARKRGIDRIPGLRIAYDEERGSGGRGGGGYGGERGRGFGGGRGGGRDGFQRRGNSFEDRFGSRDTERSSYRSRSSF
ncbi:ATP-dependent RNA helicase mss116 [Xylariomycetidae sp. FL2044]|nr:ATP-dependent RNA helicase mss116 [Xylariomycetidae sp. FL2044]